jgi:hypothetical protein
MTGIHAQLISLTSYGNAFLQAGELSDDFYPGNSTFRSCNHVDFKILKKSLFSPAPKEVLIAKDPYDWFRLLKKDGCKKIRLYYHQAENQPAGEAHKLAGMVGGGGTWMIETIYRRHSNYWFNRWEVTNKDAPEGKIWSVSYGMIDKAQPTTDTQLDIREVYSLLDQALAAITDFAERQQLPEWANVFTKARAILSDDVPGTAYYHQDLLADKHYSLTARQVLFAAGAAWVFGGMGSWNDLGFNTAEESKTYNEVSAGLFDSINQSILAVANAY